MAGATPSGRYTCPLPRGTGAGVRLRRRRHTGLGHLPFRDFGLNASWFDAAMTDSILLDGGLAKAERKTLRLRLPYAASWLVRGGRRKTSDRRDQASMLRRPGWNLGLMRRSLWSRGGSADVAC